MNQLDIFKKAETIGNISAFCDSCRTIGNHIIFTRRGQEIDMELFNSGSIYLTHWWHDDEGEHMATDIYPKGSFNMLRVASSAKLLCSEVADKFFEKEVG